MTRNRLLGFAIGIIALSALLFSATPVASLCGSCGFSAGAQFCLNDPPDFQDCRSWTERYWIWIPGDCGTCHGRFVRVEEYKCDATVPCSF